MRHKDFILLYDNQTLPIYRESELLFIVVAIEHSSRT